MKPALLALILVLALPLPVHAERGAYSRREADRVYQNCMAQYPGGWRSEREWSRECIKIADGPEAAANSARRDYHFGPNRQVNRERRRCIDDPHEINTSHCLREAEQSRW